MTGLTLIGFGTVGKVVLDSFINNKEFYLEAIVVSKGLEDTIPSDLTHIAIPWDDFISGKSRNYFVCIGYQELNAKRQEIFSLALEQGHTPVSLVHEKSFVSKSANLGKGILLMPNVTIENNSNIGDGSFVWSGTVVGHDSSIGNFSFLSANVSIGGGAKLGDNCVVGLGATIGNKVLIGNSSLIGAGVLITRHAPNESVMISPDSKILDWSSFEFLKLTDFDDVS